MSEHYQGLLKHIQRGTYFHSGGGALYKSYAYAENIAYQYWKLLTALKGDIHQRVFYMADYKPLSLRDYANSLAEHMNVRRPWCIPLPVAKLLAVAGDIIEIFSMRFPYNSFRLRNIRTEYVFDLSSTEAVCGPLPKSFEQGVLETVKWYTHKE